MEDIVIRKATERDRFDAANLFVRGFWDDFSKMKRPVEQVVKALVDSLSLDRVYVAFEGSEAIGVISCSDSGGRALQIDIAACRRNLGPVTGTIAGHVLAAEYTKPLRYPPTTGYFDFIAVTEKARRKGIATRMMRSVMDQTDYTEYMLDVTSINEVAQRLYRKFGFKEVGRVKVRMSRQKGFREKVIMKYCKKS